ncbi:class I adenylate-forming enzyme family protein [Maritimibacter sp. UBA3975]|uniref:class I adenylate-forming enzyme family protein n=1 Tax=Maritimibacter sp. UBA3975 TaxID=1946833 RepID=UPI000C0AD8D6|nr:class I adenylate-forming enzyme family protein [Maritimibacter sp. UBA3975]MAM62405.1 benzoate--CoA ligase [Maritimibacter sp.]|tara:strand:+ start:27717 stop:29255 length:1539 start_codon:yes stop_codon:yes gene_type:complete
MDATFDQGPALPPPPDPFNMAGYVLAAGQATPDKLALSVLGDRRDDWTFSRLTRAVRGIAAGLLKQGLTPGDHVLLRLGNTVEFPLAFLGAIAADLIPVPTSAMLTEAEITKMAAQVEPALIIAGGGIALPHPLQCRVLDEAVLHDLAAGPEADFALGDPERPAYAIFTSGTSGTSRAVLHAHRAIWARRMMWEGWYGLTPEDRLMHAGAFNWTYTLGTGLMDPWARGATALIPAPGTPPTTLPQLIADEAVTIFAAAPGIYRQMLRADMPPTPALRHGLTAGEKLAAPIRAKWEAATGTRLHEAFGMSECSTFVSGSPAHPAPSGTLGFPQSGRRIAVIGENGPVGREEPGVLTIHATDPGLMLGYMGAGDETRARFRGEWFLTGDTVSMGKDGAITYLGRDDDMMNAGGFRVSPVEVESAMIRHPDVHEAAAVEVAVKETARVIACVYVPEPGRSPKSADLASHAAGSLAAYKCPRVFVAVEALPKGANNKLLRRELRDRWAAGELGPQA